MMIRTTLFATLLLLLCSTASGQSLSVTMASTPACSLDGSATATVTGGTPPYTYNWNYNGNQTMTSGSNSITGLAGGNVWVQITDANNVFGWGQTQVGQPFNLNTTTIPDTCNSGVGSATVNITGGTPPFTYAWSNGGTGTSINNLTTGSYSVTVHDAAGCMYSSIYTDTSGSGIFVWNWSPIQITATTTPSSCIDGTATVTPTNGTPPYTYYWSRPNDPNFPIQTTQTATNLPTGNIRCRVTDATGCVSDRWAWVQQGNPPFSVAETVNPETCQSANGNISLNVTGGSAPFTYSWSTGATSSAIGSLSKGWYVVTITDNNGCPLVKSIHVGRTSPINLSMSAVDPACTQTNGSVTATPSNGTPPYTYAWSNGATSATNANLGPGYYAVTVTDANGCTAHDWEQIAYPASCYGTITGTVYQSNNGACTSGAGNPPMPNVLVNSGTSWTYTNGSGNYSFTELPGTYTIDQNPPIYHNQLCPTSNGNLTASIPVAGSVSFNNDFYNEPIVPVQDLRVSMHCGWARPGFVQQVTMRLYNDGTIPMNATLSFTHDGSLTFLNASPIATNYNVNTQTATWSFNQVPANGSILVNAYLQVPTTAVLGSNLSHTAVVNPTAGDSTVANNTEICNRIVTGSFDPNDKQVFPSGDIDTDQELKYTIRFQNTGTDTAFTVMISDTLSGLLDISTFREGVASHDYNLTVHGPGIFEWTFNNILLPDSNTNEPASHGFVNFYIKPKANLSPGDKIPNLAAIYFDFNAPIITNTVESTIEGVVSIEDQFADQGFQLYPNPSRDWAAVSFLLDHSGPVQLAVFNLQGQTVYDSGELTLDAGEQQLRFATDQNQFPDGMYLVKLRQGSQVAVKRLVVTH